MPGVVTSSGEIVYHEDEIVTYELQQAVENAGPTPADRTLSIDAETRTLIVEAEDRTVTA